MRNRPLTLELTKTPVQMAKHLGHGPEHRPGKKVRDVCRKLAKKRVPWFRDHVHGTEWHLPPAQQKIVIKHLAA